MKIDLHKRIGNLELCPTTSLLPEHDGRSLEICQRLSDDTYKWTIATFEYDEKEDCFYLVECCDRLSDTNINWNDLGKLVRLGRKYLEVIREIEE